MGYKRRDKSSVGVLAILILVVVGALYVYFSDTFERVPPKVELQTNDYWNLKKPLSLKMSDTSGIKSYQVILQTSSGQTTLLNEKLLIPQKEISLEIKAPREMLRTKDAEVKLLIRVNDASKWNLFNGNITLQNITLHIDKKRPQVNVIANSYKISHGGSALVVFQASDEHLKSLYILTENGRKFIPQPFFKEGYYISLMAWPVQDKSFRATVFAEDKAGNVTKSYIPLYLKAKKYKLSKIKLSDKFLHGKIADLAEEFAETEGVSEPLEQFKLINENVRARNEKLIHKITSKVDTTKMIKNFKVHIMYPLKNAKVVAHFADHRKYYYDGEFISEAYHMGLDLASHAMADIKTQNDGTVVFTDFNGLYGNMPVVDHGLGLYTIYGHCSSVKVQKGQELHRGDVIANTGKTGYAMGDHLHFGVLVQGVEVRPQEWMDKQWIKLNITNVIKSAKELINRD